MRTAHVVLCASALLLATGSLAAGCIDNTIVAASNDAGSFDSGSPDVSVPVVDSGVDATFDATIDAGVDASVTLSTATVDFGLVNCGTGTATQTYSFTNTTPVPISYSASIAGGSVFSITAGGSGTITSGASGSITIAVSGIPTASTAGTAITSTLTLTTNIEGAPSIGVPLSVTPQGGSLSVSPALAGFGQVQLAYDGTPIPLAISNVGNAPVTVTFGPPTDPDGGVDPEFSLVYAGSGDGGVTLAAGASLGDAGATFVPTSPGARSVTLAMQTTGPLCASATAIAMSGTGTPAQVVVGPNPLQFGAVPCGSTGSALQVTLTNTSPGGVAFTDALGLGKSSPFTIDVASGTVSGADGGAAGTSVITVTPKAIPAVSSVAQGAFNDTLVVTPSAPFVSPTVIGLEESASGAILSVTAGDGTSLGTVVNTTSTLPFTVTNTGTIDAPLAITVGGNGYDAGITPATAAADGGVAQGLVAFTPTSDGTDNGSVKVTTTATLCSATPPPLAITATGAVPIASFSSTAIAVASTCAAGAGTQGTLSVTNNGQAPLVISSASSSLGEFTVVTAMPMAPIAPGDSGTITIAAAAVAQNTTPGGTVLPADTLAFTTNEFGSPPRSVPVQVTVNGANLSYVGLTGNALTISTCSGADDTTYTVQNTGNLAANVTGTGSYPTDSPFNFGGAFSSTTSIAVAGSVPDTVGVNLCSETVSPCLLTAASPQTFSSFTLDGAGAPTSAGVCFPLPSLSVTLDMTASSATCQSQCCS